VGREHVGGLTKQARRKVKRSGEIDARLRRAVDANVGWYEAIFAIHGIGSMLTGGLWSSLGPPPPLHSHAVVVESSVTFDVVERRIGGIPHAGFKDSFAGLDASSIGMSPLFEATWIHRDPDTGSAGDPSAWTEVKTAADLAEWNAGYDTGEVLIPAVLERGQFRILARIAEGDVVAGAVVRLGSGAIDLSNVHAVGDYIVDWAELAAAAATRFPGRPLVGYERGDDLAGALAGGFEPVGELRVWVR
jgi:hypothetical protein